MSAPNIAFLILVLTLVRRTPICQLIGIKMPRPTSRYSRGRAMPVRLKDLFKYLQVSSQVSSQVFFQVFSSVFLNVLPSVVLCFHFWDIQSLPHEPYVESPGNGLALYSMESTRATLNYGWLLHWLVPHLWILSLSSLTDRCKVRSKF